MIDLLIRVNCGMAAVLLLAMPARVLAQADTDVGVVTSLSGNVTCTCDAPSPVRVRPFSRVRLNDGFLVPEGSSIRLVYFNSGRSELWNGPARFNAAEGRSTSERQPLEVKVLPVAAQPALKLNLSSARSSIMGGTLVRALRPALSIETGAARLAELRQMYADLRKQFPEDDMTPEIVFSGGVLEILRAETR